MRQFVLFFMLCGPFAVQADEAAWTPLSGAEISAALTGKVVQYGSAWQDFRASGKTLYNAGRDSWGYWRVEGYQYCSQWPPSDLWACYDMTRQGDRLRFIGAAGDISEAVYRPAAD
ncbi:hypothetical protein [Sulfitobacter mediterraneus]|uniref:hypothetical protein n=1 Tax=Sulfitobacter mediterraneus TaxID=83219 RepID=UPI001E471391|nr:hypothetical protein [Sulfitobacter mediterraneus]MCD2359449.1 hypothetical protein [Sulfitobacter mediterraneus]